MYICVGFYQKDVHVFGKVVLCVLAYPSQSCVYMYIDFLKVDQRYTFVFSCTKGIETQIHKSIKNKLANSKDALLCGETYGLQ